MAGLTASKEAKSPSDHIQLIFRDKKPLLVVSRCPGPGSSLGNLAALPTGEEDGSPSMRFIFTLPSRLHRLTENSHWKSNNGLISFVFSGISFVFVMCIECDQDHTHSK